MKTKQERIANHLRKGKTLTKLQAFNLYGSMSLPQVVERLRKTMTIESKRVTRRGSTYSVYWVEGV